MHTQSSGKNRREKNMEQSLKYAQFMAIKKKLLLVLKMVSVEY